MTRLKSESIKAAERISAASGVPIEDVVRNYFDAAKKGVSISAFVMDGKCYNIVLPGTVISYDAQLDVPGRFMARKCYNIKNAICPSGSHTGSKGVGRARANGRSERKVVPA